MAGAVNRRAGGESLEGEYGRHRGVVLGMLAKRFPRFDEGERLAIYHDSWARALSKLQRGEEIESLRAYLLATAGAEALNAVTRRKLPATLGLDDALLTTVADEQTAVDEQVVMRDQLRLARELIDSLEPRQRDVIKLRWDLQLSGGEIRAALGLSRRQYQRLVEEGAIAIAERVTELRDGNWSRRKKSLLAACLVQVESEDGQRRVGIASDRQRKEAQRLLESDPHVAALYVEVRRALNRAAALLPLPLLLPGGEASIVVRLAELAADGRNAVESAKQQATSMYLRLGDPTVFSTARPGTLAAVAVASLAVGGGAYGAYEHVSTPAVSAAPIAAAPPAAQPVSTPKPKPKTTRPPRPKGKRATPAPTPSPAPPTSNPPSTTTTPQPQPTSPPPQPSTPPEGQEFSFEN
jgi:DNA-directed RNA polymerase specialized sigma24 family protein